MPKRERKALVACRKGHNRALGQSLSCFSQQDIFPSMEEICPTLSLESHCLLHTCSTSHHSEITRMITFTCTPVNGTKQIQASLLRADRSHHSKPDSAPSREEPARTALCTSLPRAPALGWAVAHLHSWSKPGFDLQQSLEMPNEEQMAGLGVGAVTKTKW